MISSPVDEIKNRLDIVDVVSNYVKLHKAGVNYRGVCPFHSEKKPSFFVSPNRQTWHCFGACGEGGDMFKFIMKIEGVEFGDSLRMLAQKAGVELRRENPKLKSERQRLYEISELACKFFQAQLEKSQAKDYLKERGINEESMVSWRLGYAPDSWQGLLDFLVLRGYSKEEVEKAGLCLKSFKTKNYYDRFRARIIFPVFNLSSQVIGFGGRILKDVKRHDNQDEAKYINSPATMLYDKSHTLYGLNRSGIGIRKENSCVLVEGYTDVILAHQAGFDNVVATSGTALTNHQLAILNRYADNLLTAFDMDIAGDSATKRGIDLAQSMGFDIKVITMPEGLDPAELILKDKNKWEELVKSPKTIHDFYFDNALSRFDKDTIEGKKGIAKIILPVISKIPNKIEQTHWIRSLAEKINTKEEDVIEELSKVKVEKTDYIKETEINVSKSRKDLLQDHLIALAVKFPHNLEMINDSDSEFFSEQAFKIIQGLKTNEIKEEDKKLADELSFKLEVEFLAKDISEKDIDNEFKNCFKEIKSLGIRNRLDDICKKIKLAESENDFDKVKRLTEEFNISSKSKYDLESA